MPIKILSMNTLDRAKHCADDTNQNTNDTETREEGKMKNTSADQEHHECNAHSQDRTLDG